MADNRYNPFVSDQQLRQNTSLLLSPPSSGFSFEASEASSILLPVGHGGEPLAVDGETDSFIGQAPQQLEEPPPFTMFQQHSTASAPGNMNDPFAALGSIPVAEVTPITQSSSLPVLPLNEQNSMSKTHPSLEDVQRNNVFQANASFRRLSGSGEAAEGLILMQSTRRASSDSNVPEKFIPPPDLRRQSSVGLPSYPLQYNPVQPHWFFKKEVEKRLIWYPFSLLDSLHLEECFSAAGNHESETIVQTNGARYEVHLSKRMRYSIYWQEEPVEVRRCTWFFKGEGEKRYVPYEEHFAITLEEEFRIAITTNSWQRRLEIPGGETIMIHNPNVIVHFQAATSPVDWENMPHEGQLRPRVVKRGIEDFENIDDGESPQIDHLVFVVHGIGGFCDLKFRTVTEVVDDFRSISNSLLRSHFNQHIENGKIGRIEFLPIAWHSTLHGDATGIDTRLQPITLNSIPKLRYFANDTILDVLFYTSPVYCQTIVNQVGSEINNMYHEFLKRNPTFKGNVSLIGHSLGSQILFDLLLHQRNLFTQSENDFDEPEQEHANEETIEHEEPQEKTDTLMSILKELSLEDCAEVFEKEKIDADSLLLCSEDDLKELNIPLGPRKKLLDFLRKKNENVKRPNQTPIQNSPSKPSLVRRKSLSTVNYMVGFAGTGQPFVSYPRLEFQPSCFFALGSPIAMFLTVRGLHTIQKNFKLPTCPAFFNIFHPFDPVAYRMETLIDPSFTLKPLLIPHHKGRKRMHLEIKESLTRVGSDLKQLLVDSLKSTWNSINDFARAHKAVTAQVEAQVNKIAEECIEEEVENDNDPMDAADAPQLLEEQATIGKLNRGRRFDYVLQEKPIESFNEYLFALQSHMCYWESEDTVLLVLKEIYGTMGFQPNIVMAPRPLEFWNLPIPSKHTASSGASVSAHDKSQTSPPTAIVAPQQQVPDNPFNSPPPLAGFVRQPLRK